MKTQLDLKAIEKRAFRSTYQDGLWDIYFGLIVVFMALFLYRPQSGYRPSNIFLMLACFLVSYGLFFAGKKWITLPRIGAAKFGEVRKRKNRTLGIVLGAFVLLQVVLVVITAVGAFDPTFGGKIGRLLGAKDPGLLVVASIASLMVGGGMMAIVSFTEFLRGYYITVLMAAAVFVMVLYNKPLVPILIGALIVISGAIILIRFIRQHPVPREEEPNE